MTSPPKVAHLKCTAKTKEHRFILQCGRGWERTDAMQSLPETAHLLIALPSTLTRMAPSFGHILTIRVMDLGMTGQQFLLEQKMQLRTSPAECCYSFDVRLLLMMMTSPIPPKVTMMSVASGQVQSCEYQQQTMGLPEVCRRKLYETNLVSHRTLAQR
jgi:hypothetical protein